MLRLNLTAFGPDTFYSVTDGLVFRHYPCPTRALARASCRPQYNQRAEQDCVRDLLARSQQVSWS